MRRPPSHLVAIVLTAALVGLGTFAYLTSSAPSDACSSAPGIVSAHGAASSSPSARPGAAASGGIARAPFVRASSEGPAGPPVIPVVAAENFWGSLVGQLGGNQTSVTSIVTDPNADPHEYEASTTDARLFATAQLVIVNGVGYDDWALQLIAASTSPGRTVLSVGQLNGVNVTGGIVTGNPHMWYDPAYVNRTVAALYHDLVTIQPASRPYFDQNYAALNASLGALYAQADSLRHQFAGTVVASTESIFVYLANYTGLDLISPPEFMQAVSEGNDPSAVAIVAFECQLESGRVHVLVYNAQTVTPLTTQMQALAAQHNVAAVGVTETIQPSSVTFEAWMGGEYRALAAALHARAGGA